MHFEIRYLPLADNAKMCEEYAPRPFYRKLAVAEYFVFYHANEEKTIDAYRILRGSWNLTAYL